MGAKCHPQAEPLRPLCNQLREYGIQTNGRKQQCEHSKRSKNDCSKLRVGERLRKPLVHCLGGGAGPKPNEVGQFFLRAIDPTIGERKWEYPMTGPGQSWAGTVSTAGGVVFFGDDDGQLVAVDARDGRHLWHFYMGEGLTASPITYAVAGKQYVAIASATAIFSFALFEPTQPVPLPKVKVTQ